MRAYVNVWIPDCEYQTRSCGHIRTDRYLRLVSYYYALTSLVMPYIPSIRIIRAAAPSGFISLSYARARKPELGDAAVAVVSAAEALEAAEPWSHGEGRKAR